jgi:hypothetical protein
VIANDNRDPAEHRACVTSQATAQPRGNTRPHRGAQWPQAARLGNDDGGKFMIEAMMGWRTRNAMPVLCVANDNWSDNPDKPRQEPPVDLRMDADTADRTVALHDASKSWRPDEERFDRPHRNQPERSMPVGTYTMNGNITLYQQEANAEDETIRVIDTKNLRRRLGHVCCRLLDLASGDSTTEQIAKAVKQPGSQKMERYIDWSIIKFMREAA